MPKPCFPDYGKDNFPEFPRDPTVDMQAEHDGRHQPFIVLLAVAALRM
jgi:hypothetical protein